MQYTTFGFQLELLKEIYNNNNNNKWPRDRRDGALLEPKVCVGTNFEFVF